MSLSAMSLGHRFCVCRKHGTRGGGWEHSKGANSMVASGIGFKRPWSYLVGPPFLAFIVVWKGG